MKNKGQVTLFIIIGVVLLLILFITVQFRAQFFQVDETQTIEITPSGFQSYVETCLKTISTEGVYFLGDQGGYVEIPNYISRDSRSYFSLGSFKIPLWYFNGERRIPTIESMQDELKYYIVSNFDRCIDFSSFENKYTVNIKSSPVLNPVIGENDVTVSLNYEIELVSLSDGETTKYTDFAVALPVRLKRTFELAKDIMESEISNFDFEKVTMNLMSIDSEIPLTGLEFSCSQKKWMVSDVKNRITELLFYNIPNTRFKNTNYPQFIEDERTYEALRGFDADKITRGIVPKETAPDDAYEYFNQFFDVTSEDYSDLNAGVEFIPVTEISLNVKPSGNGVMKPNSMKGSSKFLSYMCIQFYHFTYDLNYVLRANVYDKKSFNGNGFKFSFAFPVEIKNNRPDKRESSYTLFENSAVYNDPCTRFTDKDVTFKTYGLFEGYENVELDKVNITYDCIKEGCLLGETKAISGSYKLVSKLPELCVGGIITASRDGYLTAKKQYTGEDVFEITLKKTYPFKINVVKSDIRNMDVVQNLKETEKVVLYISSYDSDATSYFEEFSYGDNINLEFVLEKGNYSIDLMLVDSVNNALLGGYKGNWTYDYSEAGGKQNVVFNVLEYLPVPITTSQQYEMMGYLDSNSNYRTKLAPRFE